MEGVITINPYDLSEIKSYTFISDVEVNKKIKQSHEAFQRWRKLNFSEKASFFYHLHDLLLENKEHDAINFAVEMGKPVKQGIAEIEKCAWVCKYYAEHSKTFLSDQKVKTEASLSYITHEPLGVILGVMPWNFPYWQVFRFIAPTLMAGNAVLIKHAPNTFGAAEQIQTLMQQAGFPKYIFQNLIVDTNQVEGIIKNPLVKAVSLTGSETAGKAVAKIAGNEIKKTVLELGGSNAFLVFPDADLEKAVDTGVNARMLNNGQSCIAAKRFILHKEIATDFTLQLVDQVSKLIVGDPLNEKTDIGPLARKDLAIELERQVKESIEKGAELLVGKKRTGAMFYPTILNNVKPGMPAFDEELFGPVISISIAETEIEMIELSNANEFGLGVSIFSQNVDRIKRYIPYFQEGAVFINELVKSDPRLPFGGINKSGIGRELGKEGIKEFVNTKTVYIK